MLRTPPKHELVLYALYLAGGSEQPVRHEDVAIRAHELFPVEFGWSGHPHLPDKDTARKALVRARAEKTGSLVQGQVTGDGWQLTAAGVDWVRRHESELQALARRPIAREGPWRGARLLERYLDSPAFHRFAEDPDHFATNSAELAELFRCRVDADSRVWNQRLGELRALGQVAGDRTVAAFADACRRQLEGERSAEASG